MSDGLLSEIAQIWSIFLQDLGFYMLAGYICGYFVTIPHLGFSEVCSGRCSTLGHRGTELSTRTYY